jgi:hypothetical protein
VQRRLREQTWTQAARAHRERRGRRLRAGDHGHRPGRRDTQRPCSAPISSISAIDIVELNEAFASQALACARDLGIRDATLNIDGGAIALGHPLGATGARIVGKAASLLQREGGRYALATQCIGGGQGIATILERI